MQTKLFEIRDRATFIPMLGIRLGSSNKEERFLLSNAGFGRMPLEQNQYVLLARLDCNNGINYDPYHWGGSRTYQTAHNYIIQHWEELESGDVIDVEYILGETKTRKTSERLYNEPDSKEKYNPDTFNVDEFCEDMNAIGLKVHVIE